MTFGGMECKVKFISMLDKVKLRIKKFTGIVARLAARCRRWGKGKAPTSNGRGQ